MFRAVLESSKEYVRKSFENAKENMTPELEEEIMNSEMYDMSTEEIVDMMKYDLEDADSEDREEAITLMREAVVYLKDLEIEIFSIGEKAQGYFDRVIEALDQLAA